MASGTAGEGRARFRRVAWAVAAALGGACGGDGGPDISGIYQTTRHELAADCVAFEPVAGPAHFRLIREDFGNLDYYAVQYCASEAPTACADDGPFGGLFLPHGSGWYTEASVSSGGTTTCRLARYTSSAVFIDSARTTLRVERTGIAGEVSGLTGDACDPSAVDAHLDALACEDHEILEGTRVSGVDG